MHAQYRVASSLFRNAPADHRSLSFSSADSTQTDSAAVRLPQLAKKSPGTAVLLSAVLPGAGQVYTGRYWKVPIILGAGGYFIAQWFRMNDHYKDAQGKFRLSVENGVSKGTGDAQLLYERDFYHDERDRFAFYAALTYLLNLVDAYVGASLYNFDVGDNLTGGTTLKISIPLN